VSGRSRMTWEGTWGRRSVAGGNGCSLELDSC